MSRKSLLLPVGLVLVALAVALVMLVVVGPPDGASPAAPKSESSADRSKRPAALLPDGGGFGSGSMAPTRPAAAPVVRNSMAVPSRCGFG